MVYMNKEYFVELQRQQWTNDVNMNSWYKNWKKFCVEQGFATDVEERDSNGNLISEITFKLDRKRLIINLDELAISLDGNSGGRGGRPSAVPCTRNISRTGTGTNKSDSSFTVIGAHNTVSEIGPFHLQFLYDAKEENHRINLGMLVGLPNGAGVFGYEKYR